MRPLSELRVRTRAIACEPELTEELIQIASTLSPSSALKCAQIAARAKGVDASRRLALAKATRWLAMIRRDYGDRAFKEVVAEIRA